jgi:GNAT superfamily N-acetyltransferase
VIILAAYSKDVEVQKWIHWMDAQCFPDSKGKPGFGNGPVSFHGSHWLIAWEGNDDAWKKRPLAYAGWRTIAPGLPLHWDQDYTPFNPTDTAFLYRAGVLPGARGRGIQKDLIRTREEMMRLHEIKTSVSYTDPLSIASMKNLMACGYEPYAPTIENYLCQSFEEVEYFVHWRKAL